MSTEIDIYSDASFHPMTLDLRSGLATWGVVIEVNGSRREKQGTCPCWITDSRQAELYAICEGIQRVHAEWPDVRSAHVYSDCKEALGLLDGQRAHLDDIARHLLNKIHATGIRVCTAYVPAHQEQGVSHRTDMNNRADAMATRRSAWMLHRIVSFAIEAQVRPLPPRAADRVSDPGADQGGPASIALRYRSRRWGSLKIS